jgi:hypothetical protein
MDNDAVIELARSKLPVDTSLQQQAILSIESLTGEGGLASHLVRLIFQLPSGGESFKFVLKRNGQGSGGLEVSKNVGLAREALFYKHFTKQCQENHIYIPKVYHAEGNFETGEYVILMEDLSANAIQSGYFFGNYSPLNWGKDLSLLLSKIPKSFQPKDNQFIACKAFQLAGHLHGSFWQDTSLYTISWLRGIDWYQGHGESTWQSSQLQGSNPWITYKSKIVEGTVGFTWEEPVIACLEASIAKCNWTTYQEEIKTRAWTMVHGDFHPANFMATWTEKTETVVEENETATAELVKNELELILLDWPMAGLGSGPQDLAQYLISHVPQHERQVMEPELLTLYHQVLQQYERVPSTYTYEQCYLDYQQGGIGRWLWLLSLLTSMCPDSVMKYFHDQVLGFIVDHQFTAENIPMMRV